MFAYCFNNPLGFVDNQGSFATRIDLTDQDEDGDGLPDEPGAAASGSKTASGYRGDLQKATGQDGKGQHAHHVFPRAFAKNFSKIGIDVKNLKYGAWWESRSHLQNSYEYNQWWKAFFSMEGFTAEDAMELAEYLAELFGFDWPR